jgi:hypothetical protein
MNFFIIIFVGINNINMAKRVYLRDYPTQIEPKIFNGWGFDPKMIPVYRKEIIEFFEKLDLQTERRSIDANEYIDGAFKDKDGRMVHLRFFLNGCYRNIVIEGDPYCRDIRRFKTLYRESPFINTRF